MIRQASIWDANKIAELWLEMSQEIMTNETVRPEYENKDSLLINVFCRIKDISWKIFVFEENSEIIGFSMGHIQYPQYNECHKIVFAESLYIKPEHRDASKYKKLISSLEAWAVSCGATVAELKCNYDSKILNFYKFIDFEPVQIVVRKKIGG